MLFYLTNETGRKISVEVPGYGQCVFSVGDQKVFEVTNEEKMKAGSKEAIEAGLTFADEAAFKSEVAPDSHASGQIWAEQVEGMNDGDDETAGTS